MMEQLINKLNQNAFILGVMMARNSVGLARTAINEGVDFLLTAYYQKGKILDYRYTEEDVVMEQIIRLSEVPVGLHFQPSWAKNERFLRKTRTLGFNFYSVSLSKDLLKHLGNPPGRLEMIVSADKLSASLSSNPIEADMLMVYEDKSIFSSEEKQQWYAHFRQDYSVPLVAAVSERYSDQELKKLMEIGFNGMLLYNMKGLDTNSMLETIISRTKNMITVK